MPVTATSVPDWDPIENLPWNDTQVVTGMSFESIGDALANEVDAAKTAGLTAIVELRTRMLNQLNQAGVPQAVITATEAVFDLLVRIVEHAAQSVADALRSVDPDVTLLYTAKSGCPVDGGDLVKLEDSEFDPPVLPSYNLDLKITISIPGILSLEIPFVVKVDHQWEFKEPPGPTDTQIESEPPTPGTEFWRKRVWSEYRYKLKYTANLAFGPYSTSLDGVWWRDQKAFSVWCP